MTVRSGVRRPPVRDRPGVSVLADLRIETGGHLAHLVGDGRSLVLQTDSPMHFWSTLNRSALPSGVGRVDGPRALGRAADLLADAGITVDITGPDGVVVRLGDNAGSTLGRLTTGSRAVHFGSPRVLLSTLSARLPVRRYGVAATAAIALAGVLVVLRRRR